MKNASPVVKSQSHRLLSWGAFTVLCLCCLFLNRQTSASSLNASSDGDQLWIAQSDAESTTIFQLDFQAKRKELRNATQYDGQLINHGIANKTGGAWLVFKDRKVWSVTADPYEPGLPNSFQNRYVCNLPSGLTPLATAGDANDTQTLWMFARIESPKTLAHVDTPADKNFKPDNSNATRAFRILKINQGKIQSVILEDNIPKFRNVWLLSPTENQKVPTLIFADSHLQTLIIYFPNKDKLQWKSPKTYTLDIPQNELQFTLASNQIIMGSRSSNRDKKNLTIAIWNIREDLDNPTLINKLKLSTPITQGKNNKPSTPWRLIPIAGDSPSDMAIGIITFPLIDGKHQLASSSCYLNGSPMQSLENINTPSNLNPLSQPGPMVLVLVLSFSTIILYFFWKRDPEWNQLALPEGYLICDLSRRLIAGLIDLLPCLWLALNWYNLTATELYDLWQMEFIEQWDELKPMGMAIGTYIAHCTLLEILTKRSIGKWVMGLKVVSLNGSTPSFWQILSRNGMKSCELIAYFLLMLPMLSPYRQRIGDMVAKTVVVVKMPPNNNTTPNSNTPKD